MLAGYRFIKSGGCKKHAARLYIRGAQVYVGRELQLSIEHILYTLGNMKFIPKDFGSAAAYLNCYMEGAVGNGHLQQMFHLRIILVHHARDKEDKSVVITLPKRQSQQMVVMLDGKELREDVLSTWQKLEKGVKKMVSGQEIVNLTSTCQPVSSNTTNNHLNPQAVTGEQISVTITTENLFNTPLQFTPEESDQVFTNVKKEAVSTMYVETWEVITMEKSCQSQQTFQLTPLTPGQLIITEVEYSLKAMFPDMESTDHKIRWKQIFNIAPLLVNSARDCKNRSGAGVDNRLDIKVVGQLPRLVADMRTPDNITQGE